eukprot:CAMPEP_0116571090 /NCGR_PEP_ID=MMETSP0397-20121206/17349_1 /TAXON_ID=216820 /ORGANISM="Cyclophora tenuis, Strain ECT3854" /LENGTH=223 /DNA_ID=CAMNT_0004099113 /DNA_START=12 /DNA_END=683 /DNA_ORIENTATION=+
MPSSKSVVLFLSLCSTAATTTGFQRPFGVVESLHVLRMSTVTAPPDQDTMAPSKSDFYDEDLGGSAYDDDTDDIRKHGPLEWLEDNMKENRENDTPFHLILLGETFDRPKITVPYVVGSLTYVLDMPQNDATDAASFSKEEGMSCLGTWEREQCLKLGRQLRLRDVLVRVVPYAAGGQRGWQARGGNDNANVGTGGGKKGERPLVEAGEPSGIQTDSGIIGFE